MLPRSPKGLSQAVIRPNGLPITLQHASPPQVVDEVLGCDAMEAGDPVFLVAHHHHRNLVLAGSTRGPDTAAPARRPQQAALSLEGLQEKGLIGFDNAALARIAMAGNGTQKAVPPQEGRVLVDAANPRGLPERQTINQGLGLSLPAIGFAQIRKGGACQGIAGAATRAASVTPQASTPAPRGEFRCGRLAMRARRQIWQALF